MYNNWFLVNTADNFDYGLFFVGEMICCFRQREQFFYNIKYKTIMEKGEYF